MFVGRTEELAGLNRLYERGGFQMVVLYGRRRVGKTTLAQEFAREKPTLSYTAKIQSDALNLRDFSERVYEHFSLPQGMGSFGSWESAFSFVAQRAGDEHLVFIFDEFPYAASRNKGLISALQVAIDHEFAHTNVMLILSGSNQGFMEEHVLGKDPRGARSDLGEKNPLFGRRTAQIKLAPFDYADAALMLPNSGVEDKVRYYACLGGTPYYLARVDESLSFEENIEQLYFSKQGLLYEEPMMLLRQELREPALYNSIVDAIANGANKPNLMANRIGEERTTVARYLTTLCDLGITYKRVPFGEGAKSRHGIYALRDALFDFWFRFVEPYVDSIERDAGELVAKRLVASPALNTYVGHRFEGVCEEWLVRAAKRGDLPIEPTSFGSWWGTDPEKREQTDIDVLACDDLDKRMLLCECKWRNKFDEKPTLSALVDKARLLPGYKDYWFAILTKEPLNPGIDLSAFDSHLLAVTARQMLEPSPIE